MEVSLESILAEAGDRIQIGDALKLAHMCNTIVTYLEEQGDAELVAAVIRTCSDMITRQHLMLQQAKLLPRAEFNHSGSTH